MPSAPKGASWGRVPTIEETLEKINAVTPEQVRAYGEGLVQKAVPALVTLGPAGDLPGLPDLARRMAA